MIMIDFILKVVERNTATQIIHLDGTDYVIYQKNLDASNRAKLKDSLESLIDAHGPITVIGAHND